MSHKVHYGKRNITAPHQALQKADPGRRFQLLNFPMLHGRAHYRSAFLLVGSTRSALRARTRGERCSEQRLTLSRACEAAERGSMPGRIVAGKPLAALSAAVRSGLCPRGLTVSRACGVFRGNPRGKGHPCLRVRAVGLFSFLATSKVWLFAAYHLFLAVGSLSYVGYRSRQKRFSGGIVLALQGLPKCEGVSRGFKSHRRYAGRRPARISGSGRWLLCR